MEELNAIADTKERENRLTELNVIEQVRNLAKTTIVQQAWSERELHLHGWVYGLDNGLINDLSVIHNSQEDINEIYRFHIKSTVKPGKAIVAPKKPIAKLKNGVAKIKNVGIVKPTNGVIKHKNGVAKKLIPQKAVSQKNKK